MNNYPFFTVIANRFAIPGFCTRLIFLTLFIGFGTVAQAGTSLANEIYKDPQGYFLIRPPAEWNVIPYSNDPRGKVKFTKPGSRGTMIMVIGADSPFSSIHELRADMQRGADNIKQKYAAVSTLKEMKWLGYDAVQMEISIRGMKQLQYQFLLNGNYYTLVFGSTPADYERLKAVGESSLSSFEPNLQKRGGENRDKQIVASKIRLAEMYIQIGKADWAIEQIDQGLSIVPGDKTLIHLRRKITESK